MKFGPMPLGEAEGAILAHAVKQGALVLKKGRVLSAGDIARLGEAGVDTVIAARLEAGDVGEDAAAVSLARHIAGAGVRVEAPFTGRSNLYAEHAGVLMVDVGAIDGLNAVDESLTAATLPAFKPVVAGEMIGTVKIIPFAVRQDMIDAAAAPGATAAIRVAAYRPKSVAVISTVLPGLKPSVIDKTVKVMAERLAPAGGSVASDVRVEHRSEALAAALRHAVGQPGDIITVFGASAITDRADVIPAAIEAAGGHIEHFGMPVDPGNLLLIGSLGGRPVIGAPGCARSPRENGFDWVLSRLMADVPVGRADIQKMGVGGLLMEIVARPQPREGDAPTPIPTEAHALSIKIVLLAAGRSTRMGGPNKLLSDYQSKPLVSHAAEAALAAGVGDVIAVTGHQAEKVSSALGDLPVRRVHNPHFAVGLSSSLKAGLEAAGSADAVIVMLGDMPLVAPHILRRLAGAYAESPQAKGAIPTSFGQRGNPVLIGKALFDDIRNLSGDEGARRLIEAAGADIVEVPVDDAGIHRDIDTPEALAALRN